MNALFWQCNKGELFRTKVLLDGADYFMIEQDKTSIDKFS
jgi:hypothetical protein